MRRLTCTVPRRIDLADDRFDVRLQAARILRSRESSA